MKTFFYFIFLTFITAITAQESDTLTTRYKVLAKGSLFVTGNNILNRQEKKTSANDPNNDISGSRSNDDLTMEYIDIDRDKHTFSSSSSSVIIPKKSKILFAGLYWTATYPFERGEKKGDKISIVDTRREPVEEVLLKLPKGKYTPIKGEFVFDGNTDSRFIGKNAPYIVFADITSLVQNAKRYDGDYTVANIRSAKGSIEEGACAGWSLVIAYENTQDPLRKIEVKDGFIEVKNSKDIIFNNFKIPSSSKEVFPILIGGALDADLQQGENKIGVFSKKVGVYLETKTRKVKNFLNSSITYAEDYWENRKPNSKNTLGFDIFSLEVPNYDFEIFPVGGDFLRVNFSTTKNNFYTFLLGLAIDTEENISLRDAEVDKILGKPTQKPVATPTDNVAQTTPKESSPISNVSQPATPKNNTTNTSMAPNKPETIPSNVHRISAENVKKGFYLILGAYSNKQNAEKYMFNLRQKGVHAEGSFFYPTKNLYYAYSYYVSSYEEALKKQKEVNSIKNGKPELEKMKDVWILIVE